MLLRLSSRSRNRNVKNKHSKIKKNTQEKSKYEDYNEIILNDLVQRKIKKSLG